MPVLTPIVAATRAGVAAPCALAIAATTLLGSGIATADTQVERSFDLVCVDPKLAGTITQTVRGNLPDTVQAGTQFSNFTFGYTATFGPEMAKAIRARGGTSAVGVFGTQVHAKDSSGNSEPAATINVQTASVPLPPTDVPMTFEGSASYQLRAPETAGPATVMLASALVIRALLDTQVNIASQCGYRPGNVDRRLGSFVVQ